MNIFKGRTAPANASAIRDATPPSPVNLRDQLAETRQRLDALLAERSNLALPAINGNTGAEARILEIDRERATLASREETIQQALVSLKHNGHATEAEAARARQLAKFERELPLKSSQLAAAVIESITRLVKQASRFINDRELFMASRELMGVRNFERLGHFADALTSPSEIVGRIIVEHAIDFCYLADAHLVPQGVNQTALQQRKDAAITLQREMVSRLVAATDIKPPADLIEVHARLVHLLREREREVARQQPR